jgi:hypothetical protein
MNDIKNDLPNNACKCPMPECIAENKSMNYVNRSYSKLFLRNKVEEVLIVLTIFYF